VEEVITVCIKLCYLLTPHFVLFTESLILDLSSRVFTWYRFERLHTTVRSSPKV